MSEVGDRRQGFDRRNLAPRISPRTHAFALRRSLTTKRTFLVVLFLGLFAMAARNVDDPDVWWHLKTGEYIAAHESVPRTDPFSYTRAGHRWIAHEWLTELTIFEIQRTAGFAGLIIVFAVIITAAFVLLYLRCGLSTYAAGVITLLGALATRPVWGVRPQVVSLFLISLWILILERSEKNPRLLWWTLPLTLLWVNLHAGFAFGLAISALFIAGSIIEHSLHHEADKPWRFPTLILLLDFLLVSLNPNGARMFFYPIETLRSPAMQTYIAEWASPNFHHGEYVPVLLLVLITILTLACSQIPLRPRDLLLLLVSLFACLVSIRMIPFFVLFAVPVVSRRLGTWPRNWPLSEAKYPSQKPHALLNLAIVIALALFAVVHIRQVINRQPAIEAGQFPSRAVAFLNAHRSPGHIFNHYDWGGYLIWKLSPSVPVFIDGRADLYGERLFHDFTDAYQLKNSWQQVLAHWNIQTVLVPSDSALAAGLSANPAWSIAYQDSQAIVYRNSSADLATSQRLILPFRH